MNTKFQKLYKLWIAEVMTLRRMRAIQLHKRIDIRCKVYGVVMIGLLLSAGIACGDLIPEAVEPLPGPVGLLTAWTPCLSVDGLQLFFASDLPEGYGGNDLYVSRRASIEETFGEPENLGPMFNGPYRDQSPNLSYDGLEFYFVSNRESGNGGMDIWVSRRETIESLWGEPKNADPNINSYSNEWDPYLLNDGLTLYFFSDRTHPSGGSNIWYSRRTNRNEPWGEPENIYDSIDFAHVSFPIVSDDELFILFASDREGGYGGVDLWTASRTDTNEPFEYPRNLGPQINTEYFDWGGFLSRDNQWLIFVRDGRLLQARIMSIQMFPDLNSDFLVNFQDFSILAQNMWSESEIYDISGDGVVNTIDLAGLVYCWLKGSQASDPGPSDGATEVSPMVELNWTAGFGAVSHDVYFGTSDPPPFIHNQTEATFNPVMSYDTTYYWRIDEVNVSGITAGNVWSFTTESSPPPPPPPS
jgi:hypothetical protein